MAGTLWFSAAVISRPHVGGRRLVEGRQHQLGRRVVFRRWQRLDAAEIAVTWKERHEFSMFVFSGQALGCWWTCKPLSNEVWSLYLPPNFFEKI